jgi:hypothetical protein
MIRKFRLLSAFVIRGSSFSQRIQAQTSGDDKVTAKSDQEFSAPHYLFAIEPNVEIAADAIDVRFRHPVCAGVLGVGMTKSNVYAGNLFILQNMANNMHAGGVRADSKFADAVTVLVGAGVGSKFISQILVLRFQRADPIIFH